MRQRREFSEYWGPEGWGVGSSGQKDRHRSSEVGLEFLLMYLIY